MFFRRFILTSIATASVAVVVVSFTGVANFGSLSIPFVEPKVRHSLTGIEGDDAPVLVVKIDDTTYAHPQVGLRSADVIYIEQVEGGLSRLAAVFSSTIPDVVGPVRSARISDLELLAQYGRVGFAFSGAQKKLLPEIASANLIDVSANRFGPTFYSNAIDRNAPYAMMLKAPELIKESESRGNVFEKSRPIGWSFGDEPEGLIPIKSARVTWPAASYDVEWSEGEERWLLSHNGSPNLDNTGYQLGSPTFVVQLVAITNSEYRDKVGGITPFSATVGSGDCFLLRGGGYLPCRWSRPDPLSGTTFTDRTGAPINFAPGQIWIALTAAKPEFALAQSEDATSQASK